MNDFCVNQLIIEAIMEVVKMDRTSLRDFTVAKYWGIARGKIAMANFASLITLNEAREYEATLGNLKDYVC